MGKPVKIMGTIECADCDKKAGVTIEVVQNQAVNREGRTVVVMEPYRMHIPDGWVKYVEDDPDDLARPQSVYRCLHHARGYADRNHHARQLGADEVILYRLSQATREQLDKVMQTLASGDYLRVLRDNELESVRTVAINAFKREWGFYSHIPNAKEYQERLIRIMATALGEESGEENHESDAPSDPGVVTAGTDADFVARVERTKDPGIEPPKPKKTRGKSVHADDLPDDDIAAHLRTTDDRTVLMCVAREVMTSCEARESAPEMGLDELRTACANRYKIKMYSWQDARYDAHREPMLKRIRSVIGSIAHPSVEPEDIIPSTGEPPEHLRTYGLHAKPEAVDKRIGELLETLFNAQQALITEGVARDKAEARVKYLEAAMPSAEEMICMEHGLATTRNGAYDYSASCRAVGAIRRLQQARLKQPIKAPTSKCLCNGVGCNDCCGPH